MAENKNREQQLRRTLNKFGYALRKSRKQNWHYDNQCGFMIIDIRTNGVVGGMCFDLSLDDVAEWIEQNS